MEETNKILLGKAGQADAQRLQRLLQQNEIEIAIVHNQATCTKGCAVELEIWANQDDVASIGEILAQEKTKLYESMGYDPQLSQQVYDADQPTATCPACSTVFETSLNSCPECGLCFVAG